MSDSSRQPWQTSLTELVTALSSRELSAVDAVDQALARISEVNPAVNAVCTLDAEAALRAARAADLYLSSGGTPGPLHGIPVLVKDMIFTKGLRTTGGSRMYRDFVPAQDDVSVERLRGAGAIILGKTNTAEFGFSGNQTANLLFGETRNPWNLSRTPGGSSGGSAAAVASGMAAAALGTDGGGSIRIPSSFCGTFGLKPTSGRVALHPSCRDAAWPGFSGWESLEHLGPITRTVRDGALMLDVLSGYDSRDRLSCPTPPARFCADLDAAVLGDLSDLRVAVSADWSDQQLVDSDVRQAFDAAVRLLRTSGCHLAVDQPDCEGALEAFGALVDMDFDVAAIAEMCAGQEDQLGSRVRQLLTVERSAAGYSRAVRQRKQLYSATEVFFERFDVLISPTTPVAAFPLDHNGPETVGGIPPADRVRAIVGYCCPFNVTGHPAASVPWGLTAAGLPVGIQVVAPRFREDLIFRVAAALEQASSVGQVRALAAMETS